MADRTPTRAAFVVATAAVFAAGCYSSHGEADAGASRPVMPPPSPGVYDVGPAPGEGTLCPWLPEPPPGCAGEGTGYCDAAELTEALAGARPGDVVRVGPCRVSASLTVPPGVTLAGVDPLGSVVVAPSGQPAIVLSAASSPSVSRCLSVEANRAPGISVEGPGEARVEYVMVHAATGVGVSAEGVGRLSLHGVDLAGPVTPTNASMQPLDPTPEETGVFGLQLHEVGEVTIYGTTIRGFAYAGLLATETAVTLRAVEISGNLGAGALFAGSPVCARSLSSDGALQGTRLIPSYGIVLTQGAEFHGADVSIRESEAYAILQDGSSLDVEGLVLEGNQQGGLWVQRGGETAIRGPGTRIIDNHSVGVSVCNAASVSISGAKISRTQSRVRIIGTMPVEIGAGLVLGAVENIRLT
ncbi:MAG: right-handed parallel beta-helix repeat-containing protein, partial [Deltaproteobacteria bacterium]|nr:right-handed parallel beta-helix repeat-containing protein [Deltaproteobacteria bacterium]